MQLNIITREKTLFSGDAQLVTIPGSEGDFGVLTGHAPVIAMLRPGVVAVETANGEKRAMAIGGGFAEVNPESTTILAETAVECDAGNVLHLQAKLDETRSAIEEAMNNPALNEMQKSQALADAIK